MRFLTKATAAATVATLMAGSAFASTMLETSVQKKMEVVGISEMEVSASDLSLDQLAEIKVILDGSDTTDIKEDRIKTVIGNPDEPGLWTGYNSLANNVETQLEDLGFSFDPEVLTVAELAKIKTILGSEDTQELKKERVETVLN